MRRLKLLLLVVVGSFATACGGVSQAEFNTFKADVKVSGDAVDTWIAAAHKNIIWLRQIVIANHCGSGSSCDPPAPPPSPPPDGGWGS